MTALTATRTHHRPRGRRTSEPPPCIDCGAPTDKRTNTEAAWRAYEAGKMDEPPSEYHHRCDLCYSYRYPDYSGYAEAMCWSDGISAAEKLVASGRYKRVERTRAEHRCCLCSAVIPAGGPSLVVSTKAAGRLRVCADGHTSG